MTPLCYFYCTVGGAGVPRRRPALDLWRRIHQSDRDAVLPLQGPLVLPLRLETLGEGECEHFNAAKRNFYDKKILELVEVNILFF
jgi:hypothetical protein